MPFSYGHHQPPSFHQEIVTSVGHAVHRLLSEQTHIFLTRFDKLEDDISQLRSELVEIKEAGREQINQVSNGLRRASIIQAAANDELEKRLDEFEKAVCGEDSKIFLKLKAIDENVLELYEKAMDPLAALPEPPVRHEVATSPIKIAQTPSTNEDEDEDEATTYRAPSFVTPDWSVTLADVHTSSTPNTNNRVFIPDLSLQGRERYSLLSNSNFVSLKDCVRNSESRVSYVHTGVSPIAEMQTQNSPQPDLVHVDPASLFEEYLPARLQETPPTEPDHTTLSPLYPVLESSITYPDSPLTSVESDSGDDEEHVSKMVVPSSVSPPIVSSISASAVTFPIHRKRLSESPSKVVSKKRKSEVVPVAKKKRKTIWPETSTESSSSAKWISCDVCNLWYHYGCVGIHSDKQPKRFKCPPCRSGQTIVATPRQGNSMECARKDCCNNSTGEFVISRIIGRSRDRRTIEGKYVWLVEWEGYDISAATWQEEHTISDPRSLIRQFYKALQIAGVQNDPETRVILPSVEKRLPEDLLALFP